MNGQKGLEGNVGFLGAPGRPGLPGLPGRMGEKGQPAYLPPEEAARYKGLPGLVGQRGDRGDKGRTGIQGLQGDSTPQDQTQRRGERGDTGDTGLQGFRGDKGKQGPAGDEGTSKVKLRNSGMKLFCICRTERTDRTAGRHRTNDRRAPRLFGASWRSRFCWPTWKERRKRPTWYIYWKCKKYEKLIKMFTLKYLLICVGHERHEGRSRRTWKRHYPRPNRFQRKQRSKGGIWLRRPTWVPGYPRH